MRARRLYMVVAAAAILLLPCAKVWAAFGEDIEAPKPRFSQEGDDWIATLIPRGKSTEIQIRFHVTGGALTAADAKVFAADAMPKVDKKTFRSDFFSLQITPGAPGGEVALAVNSDYFTTATELWAPSAKDALTWNATGAVNVGNKDRTNTLTVTLRDGGPLDADGKIDGHILAVIGPRDSFWGYALGTLLIRFFGVFIVLGVLLLGMLISGKIFQILEARALRPSAEPLLTAALEAAQPASAPAVTPEAVAAIALAIHLNSAPVHAQAPTHAHPKPTSAWAIFGRGKLMGDRMPVFDRIQKK